MDSNTIKQVLNKLAESKEEKEAVFEWSIWSAVCELIYSDVKHNLRRQTVLLRVNEQLDKWIQREE